MRMRLASLVPRRKTPLFEAMLTGVLWVCVKFTHFARETRIENKWEIKAERIELCRIWFLWVHEFGVSVLHTAGQHSKADWSTLMESYKTNHYGYFFQGFCKIFPSPSRTVAK